MSSGIYAYWDNVRHYYVYVGKDSNIDKKTRHYKHVAKYSYNEQPINRVLQNNPERYEYRVIMQGNYNDWQLNQMEKLCIKSFKTFKKDYPERNVFNFTKGGDGLSGWTHSEETRKKIGKSRKGNKHSEAFKKTISNKMSGEGNPMYGSDRSGKNNPMWKKTHSKETRKKIANKMTKYLSWNVSKVRYNKQVMFKNNKIKEIKKAFILKFNNKNIPIGGFIDFITPEIIHDLICEAIEDYNE